MLTYLLLLWQLIWYFSWFWGYHSVQSNLEHHAAKLSHAPTLKTRSIGLMTDVSTFFELIANGKRCRKVGKLKNKWRQHHGTTSLETLFGILWVVSVNICKPHVVTGFWFSMVFLWTRLDRVSWNTTIDEICVSHGGCWIQQGHGIWQQYHLKKIRKSETSRFGFGKFAWLLLRSKNYHRFLLSPRPMSPSSASSAAERPWGSLYNSKALQVSTKESEVFLKIQKLLVNPCQNHKGHMRIMCMCVCIQLIN